MDFDFSPFFKRYESILSLVDSIFDKMAATYPDAVRCRKHCADCCHALFDLTLVEALYVHHRFQESLDPVKRHAIIEKAGKIDRRTYQIKRKAFKDHEAGKPEDEIMAHLSAVRIRCPLLNDQDLCDLYEYRPVTCRLYGIPGAISGRSFICGTSGFSEGKSYPTVNQEPIRRQLLALSYEIVQALQSRHVRMGDMLIPLSMALITVFDDEFLGVSTESSHTSR